MTIRLRVGQDEPISVALRRFKKICQRERHSVYAPHKSFHSTYNKNHKRFKRYRKLLIARIKTLEAQRCGIQPVTSLKAAKTRFLKRQGKG